MSVYNVYVHACVSGTIRSEMGCNNSKDTKVVKASSNGTALTSGGGSGGGGAGGGPDGGRPDGEKYYRGARLFQPGDFIVQDFIQEGGQGKVFVGEEKSSGKKFALKVSELVS